MLHQELWQRNNEEWVKSRKKEWPSVKAIIEDIKYTSAKKT